MATRQAVAAVDRYVATDQAVLDALAHVLDDRDSRQARFWLQGGGPWLPT